MKYKLKEDINVRCGYSSFLMTRDSVVSVKQEDEISSKVLIHWGGRDVDWYPTSILKKMEKINEN